MNDQTKLLPCPFCGGPAIRFTDRMPMVECESIDCFGPRTTAGTIEDAVAQWNTRAALSSPDQDRLSAVGIADIIEPVIVEIARKFFPEGAAPPHNWKGTRVYALEAAATIIDRLSRQPEASGRNALEAAREYVESDVRNKQYPKAVEVLALIDAALRTSPRLDREKVVALLDKIGSEARRYASHYPLHSDGSNTFVMFAEWVENLSGEQK